MWITLAIGCFFALGGFFLGCAYMRRKADKRLDELYAGLTGAHMAEHEWRY